MEEVLMMFVGLGIPAIVILAPFVLRTIERKHFWRSVVATTEKGQPIPTELAEAFLRGARRSPPLSTSQLDTRRGIVLTAAAIGIALIGLCIYIGGQGDGDSLPVAMGVTAVAAIPGCVGIAFIVLGWLGKREDGAEKISQ